MELGPDGRIAAVAARRAVLTRAGSASQGRQVLAANIDTVLIVVPLAGGLNAAMVERLSVMAWDSGAQPVLVPSKSDTTDDGGAQDAAELLSPGIPVLPVSVRTGEGLDTLRAHLGPGTTAVMLGPSGAGKTSLLNALEGTDEAVATIGRSGGRHTTTTTTRRLHLLASGGVLLDIPGIRSLEVAAGRSAVDDVFTDIAALAPYRRYTDCGHDGDLGCAVEEAARAGTLPATRLAAWHKLQGEIAYRRRREDPAEMADTRRQWKAVSKQARRNRR